MSAALRRAAAAHLAHLRSQVSGSTPQARQVNHDAGLGSVSGVAEEPRFSAGRKNSDVVFQNVVINRHPAVADVAR
jgi:hypothetical protein